MRDVGSVGGGTVLGGGVGRVDDAGGPRRLETPVSLWSTRSRAVNLLSHRTPLAAAMGDKVCDCLRKEKREKKKTNRHSHLQSLTESSLCRQPFTSFYTAFIELSEN